MPTYSVNYGGKSYEVVQREDGKFVWPAGVPKTESTTFATNVLTHGTGAFNIDGCRVGTDTVTTKMRAVPNGESMNAGVWKGGEDQTSTGRFPPNVVFTHDPECGTSKPAGDEIVYDCAPGCPVAELDAQSGIGKSVPRPAGNKNIQNDTIGLAHGAESNYADSGGASRFFPTFKYQAKAPTKERPKVDGKAHATVKPLSLMAWLVRLVTQPGGIVLEPFAGSGTTVQAALDEGFRCIAVEYEEDHMPLIKQRLADYTDVEFL